MDPNRTDFKSQNPTVLVIFGATGDLARRKLIPALFDLHAQKLLPPLFQVVGFSRREIASEEFQNTVRALVEKKGASAKNAESFSKIFSYTQGFFEDAEGYEKLATMLGRQDNEWRTCANKLFYLAVPPEHYEVLTRHLAKSGLTEPCSPEEGWTRVIVEKPFGRNFETAEALDILLGKLFKEEQIYRIDHYLGKETVQNILAFRFANSFLEPSWNKRAIESISIVAHEDIGVESRGEFYDSIGALRDFGQNHLLQLLALFTMENPGSFGADAVRAKRAEILRMVRFVKRGNMPSFAVRGQYEGYRDEKGVSARSKTETYFRVRAFVETPRWRGVPMYLESGKKLLDTRAEVTVVFRHRNPCLCPKELGAHFQNILHYEIQPEEKITLSFAVKKPGLSMVVEEKDFSFNYHRAYTEEHFGDPHVYPYRKLLLDAIMGNQTLFVSTDEIKASWKFIDPIIERWTKQKSPLIMYKPGTMPELGN